MLISIMQLFSAGSRYRFLKFACDFKGSRDR
jgi:hypothetical protein